MSKAAVLRLRAEIESDLAAFDARAREVRSIDLDEPNAGDLARATLALHHGYSAVESILERIARHIEGSIPDGADWHKALLDASTLEVPTVRPALLARETVRDLHDLRTFRHFLRHAYAVELDATEFRRHTQTAERLLVTVVRDVQRALAWLAEVAERS